ncbi:hypothetical protein DIPPA_10684 [Diplonema papillatum]|nr:hypothetical protein DIPPA_10684 [Diplonema papillatum]
MDTSTRHLAGEQDLIGKALFIGGTSLQHALDGDRGGWLGKVKEAMVGLKVKVVGGGEEGEMTVDRLAKGCRDGVEKLDRALPVRAAVVVVGVDDALAQTPLGEFCKGVHRIVTSFASLRRAPTAKKTVVVLVAAPPASRNARDPLNDAILRYNACLRGVAEQLRTEHAAPLPATSSKRQLVVHFLDCFSVLSELRPGQGAASFVRIPRRAADVVGCLSSDANAGLAACFARLLNEAGHPELLRQAPPPVDRAPAPAGGADWWAVNVLDDVDSIIASVAANLDMQEYQPSASAGSSSGGNRREQPGPVCPDCGLSKLLPFCSVTGRSHRMQGAAAALRDDTRSSDLTATQSSWGAGSRSEVSVRPMQTSTGESEPLEVSLHERTRTALLDGPRPAPPAALQQPSLRGSAASTSVPSWSASCLPIASGPSVDTLRSLPVFLMDPILQKRANAR